MSRLKSIVIVVFLLMGYGLSGFMFFGNVKLKKELRLSEEMIDEANRKKEGIYKKYKEKNALSVQLTRAKSSLEGSVSKAVEDARDLEMEKDRILAQKEDIEKEINEKSERIALLEAEIKGLEAELESAKKEEREAQEKFLSDIEELEKSMDKLDVEKQELNLDLKSVKGALERSRAHNAELCAIAEELLTRYEDKGPLTSLLEKEPFVQTKRVELEKYTQEYKEMIEEHRETQQEGD